MIASIITGTATGKAIIPSILNTSHFSRNNNISDEHFAI